MFTGIHSLLFLEMDLMKMNFTKIRNVVQMNSVSFWSFIQPESTVFILFILSHKFLLALRRVLLYFPPQQRHTAFSLNVYIHYCFLFYFLSYLFSCVISNWVKEHGDLKIHASLWEFIGFTTTTLCDSVPSEVTPNIFIQFFGRSVPGLLDLHSLATTDQRCHRGSLALQ